MVRRLAVLAVAMACAVLPSPAAAADPLDATIAHDLAFADAQLRRTLAEVPSGSYPHYTRSDGTWLTRPAGWWISGFLPGSLWHMYEGSGDPFWRTQAAARQAGIESQKTSTSTHDLGFMIFDSFGNGYRLTGDDSYRQVALTAASSLSTRYSPVVRAIRSHNNTSSDDPTDFKVIVDNMMNLELLTWAARHGASRGFATQALEHALRTAAEHVRSDGSTYQRVIFDSNTGAVKRKDTQQGYSTDSTWARGQAWAVYGYTMAYRELNDARMLATARLTADWYLSHLPADSVPYWDFQAPNIPSEPRDSSAAAIAASGLIELAQLEPDRARAQRYMDGARAAITALTSPAYLAEGTSARSLLLHGTSHKPAGEYDHGLIYGDYFFLEALLRFRAVTRSAEAERPADFDKDGHGDLAAGAPGENSGAGQVSVVYGAAGGLGTRTRQLTQSQAGGGAEPGDAFGEAFAAGDFDRDGYTDLAVGAPDEDHGTVPDAGQVNVVYGGPAGLGSGRAAQGLGQGLAAGSAETGDRFAAALTSGDFDGDGYADLAVGAPGEGNGSAGESGAVNVIYGSPSGLGSARAQQVTQALGGGSVEGGDGFGSALAAARFDGDARSDLAVGAPGEDAGSQADAGYVNVLHGTAAGLTRNRGRELGQGLAGGAAEAGDRFGAALAAGGFDGDGLAELSIGAPGEDLGSATDAGAVNVVHGSPTGVAPSRGRQFHQGQAGGTAEAGDRFGEALAAASFNGDGRVDLAAGAPGEDHGSLADAGQVNVLYGADGGLSTSGAKAFGQGLAAGTAEPGDRFGAALAPANPDADGFGDLAVGAPGEDDGSTADVGVANLLYGGSGGLAGARAQQLTQGRAGGATEAGDRFGAGVR